MTKEQFFKIAQEISKGFQNIPILWDGRKSILEMKGAGFNQWKQMEWIGWYFQFLCEKLLRNAIKIPAQDTIMFSLMDSEKSPGILRRMQSIQVVIKLL